MPLLPPLPRTPRLFILSWGGFGYMRPAPGTWGTLGGMPFALAILFFAQPLTLLYAAGALYALAYVTILAHEKITKAHDESFIVIDEVIGIFIALVPAAFHIVDIALAFALFRLFDALKPGPIGWIDKNLKGPHGVLLDDVLAGLLTAACMVVFHYAV